MPIRARILLAILLAALLGGGIWFYLQRTAPQPAATLTLFGNVDIREVQPTFNASGHITAMLVREGATVRKGQLLATLDDTRYAATLAQAKATAAAARVTAMNDEVNYRRFFNINELAGIRIENSVLFDLTHRLVGRLMREGRQVH